MVGASGAPGVYMGRRLAGRSRRDIAYAQGMLQRQRLAARCALRGQRVPKFAPNQESQPPQSVLILRRVNSDSRWQAFVQTSQDSLGWVGGFENVNFYAARRWNSLLAPRSSKGRYRSPTGPACCMERTFRPRCPPGRTRARRPVAASAARSGPLRCMRMHSRTKMTSGGQSIYTSQRRARTRVRVRYVRGTSKEPTSKPAGGCHGPTTQDILA